MQHGYLKRLNILSFRKHRVFLTKKPKSTQDNYCPNIMAKYEKKCCLYCTEVLKNIPHHATKISNCVEGLQLQILKTVLARVKINDNFLLSLQLNIRFNLDSFRACCKHIKLHDFSHFL